MTKIPFMRPSISQEEVKVVTRVLKSGWLTMGKETQKFEEEFADYVGAKYAVAVNSCTAALFLSLKSLGVSKGDEIIVPSFTFPSTVSVIIHCGAVPRFADIKREGMVMDQKSFEKVMTKRTRAVIPVHYGGNRADIVTDLPIIEDSAHLIPRKGNNNKAFSVCYSFYVTKNMTTGEGGMIVLNDAKLARQLGESRLHGLSYDAWKRYKVGSKFRVYKIKFPGYKANTTDINSALGRVQLRKLDRFEKRRKKVLALYNKLLGLHNRGTHLYPILVEKRDEFFEYMTEHGIGVSFHFKALHLEPAFKKYSRGKLPVTEYVSKRVVTLPLDAKITNSEVEKVVKLVKLLGPA